MNRTPRAAEWVAAALFLTTASFTLARTARDALYFQAGGIYDLPLAYMAMAVLALPMAAGTLGLMKRLGARRTRMVVPLLLAGLLLVFAAVARPGGGPLMTGFFLFVPLAYGVLFSLLWLLAADVLDGSDPGPRARAYGRIGAASLLGNLTGAATARALAAVLDPNPLLGLAAISLAAGVLVIALIQRRRTPRRSIGLPGLPARVSTVGSLIRDRYFRLLLIVGVCAALAGVLVEFQFYLSAAGSGNTARENVALFANLYLALGVVALTVQLTMMTWLHRRVGLNRVLLVLPAALAVLTPATIVNASLMLFSTLRLAEGGLKSSIHRVSWEQAYLPLPPSHRGTAKLLIDGSATRLAEGSAALLLFVWLRNVANVDTLGDQDLSWVTYGLLAAAVVWVVATRALVRHQPRSVSGGMPPAGAWLDVRLPDT